MAGIQALRQLAVGLVVLTLAVPVVAQVPEWQEQGPNGIRNNGNQQNITPNSTVSGAVQSITLNPTNSAVAVVATTNGGLWRTTDSGSTWNPVAQTNTTFTSLSFGEVAYDATDSNVLVAGYGRFSSLSGRGGAQAGMLRSTDGGVTWTSINGAGSVIPRHHQVTSVYAAGSTIVAATSFADVSNTFGNIGLIRSTDGGANWSLVSGSGPGAAPNGLPGGYILGMTGRRVGGSDILLAGTQQATTNGIYRSTDGGGTWSLVNNAALTSLFTSGVSNVKFAFGANDTAWAAVVNNSGVVNGIFRSADNGATWSAASLDTAVGGSTLNPGFQGGTHLSITADPTNDQIVYVGGDRTPASTFGAQMFRINAGLASGSQGSLFYGADTSNNSIPHADTRSMGFDAAGRFWLANDGGMYRRDDVTAGAGQWVSLNAGLRTTEVTGVAYDRLTKALITGQQDNATAVMAPGTTVNTAFARKVWTSLLSGDGGRVAADPLVVGGSAVGTTTSRYYSVQNLGSFRRTTYDSGNNATGTVTPSLTVNTAGSPSIYSYDTNIQFVQPIAVNQVEGGRLYIGTRRIYESTNQGNLLQDLNGDLAASAGFNGGTSVHGLLVNKMLAGGRTGATLNPNVLYVGTSSVGSSNIGGQLFVRTASGSALGAVARVTGYSTTAGTVANNSSVRDVATDTANWQSVYVVTPKRVWAGTVTTAASSTWTDFTGNLTHG
ncbi:MAG: sialidase family protein, partial [Gemmataceae bacterium]